MRPELQHQPGPGLVGDPFCWAAGIEDTFIPQYRPGLRSLDEYELTQHYSLWRSDFELVKQSGVKALRWGIPWYRVQPASNRWDWGWVDEVLDTLVNTHRITPILDLMHYGTPLWLDNSFLNKSYPARVAEYTARAAERYGSLVRHYTPMNEPVVNADQCGRRGIWPPYLIGDDGFVQVLLALARGIVETTRILREVQPGCVLIQVEALWNSWTQDASLERLCSLNNARQYLAFDLSTGRIDEDPVNTNYLLEHGATHNVLNWFQENAVEFDILGANFYPWSQSQLMYRKNGRVGRKRAPVNGTALGEVVRKAWRRYQMPVMVTETSANAPLEERARWMDETIAAVRSLRVEGVPVVGYTWFPVFSMIDWAYRTGRKPAPDYLLHLGLFESSYDADRNLQRRPTSLVDRYRAHQLEAMPALTKEEVTI